MSVKLEKVVEKFYEGLEEGKFLGRKCKECGAVEFPPVYACNTCGCMAYGEVEIEEGASFNAVVKGINKKKRKELLEKLPVPVHAEIFQRDGYKTVVFALDEE